MMIGKARVLVMSVLAALVVGIAPAPAQILVQGSVRGTITDQQGAALPGVTVTARRSVDGKPFTTTTDGRGTYRLLELAPGDYAIEVELAGFARHVRPGVLIRAGLNIALDVQMTLGPMEQTVEVKADSPMLEVDKPVQAVNISGEFQRALPLNARRDWSDFFKLTPGIVEAPLGGSTSYVYYLRGSAADAHVVQLDGADIGSFRQGLTSYIALGTEAIADVQLKTGGVNAAAPLGHGVVVNIVTTSGTNKLAGAVLAAYTPQRWNGNNLPGGTPAISRLFQPDLSAGGPVVKDRLWFFGTYRFTYRNTGIARTPKQLADLQALKPSFKPFMNENRLHYQYYKVNGQIRSGMQYQTFYQRELNPEETNVATVTNKLGILSLGGQAFGGRLSTVLGASTTLRVLGSFNDKGLNPNRGIFDGHQGTGPALTVYNSTVTSAGLLVGNGVLATMNNVGTRVLSPASKITLQADVTHFRRGWMGSHELQAGVFIQPRLRSVTSLLYANGGYTDEQAVLRQAGNPAGGFVPFFRRTYDREQQTTASISGGDYALYLQDDWKPTARLSINAGVRLDWVKATDHLIDVVSMDSLNIGPRVGLAYLLTKDAKNVARANFGRVHIAPTSAQFNPGVATAGAGFTDQYDLNLDGVFETTRFTPPFTRTSVTRTIDPDRHLPFIDEWVLGYGRQLPGQVSVEASFVRRTYRHIVAAVEYNGIYEGGVFKGYRDEAVNEVFRLTNNTWNSAVYSGLEFVGSKRTARMQIIGSYTRAFRHLSGTWQPNDPASFIQPDAFDNSRGLTGVTGSATNSLTPSAFDPLPWLDNVAQTGVTYHAPWNLLLATSYSFQFGAYSGPIITQSATPDPRFGPSSVTLSNGRTVTNPLATTRRFAHATRTDNQLRAPSVHVWNVRAGREFPVGRQRLTLALDVYNVTNNATDTQFLGGGNELFNPNYGRRADGTFNGTARQFARSGQISVRYVF